MRVYKSSSDGVYIQITDAAHGWPAWVCLRSNGEMVLCSHRNVNQEVHKINLNIINLYWTEYADISEQQLEFDGKALHKALSTLIDKHCV